MTIADFMRDLSTLGLLAPADLTALEASLAANTSTNPEALAKDLVQQGKLSRYQAAAIYQGKAATLLVGNYLILDRIGAGGMGQVFRARHRKMDRVVALKVLPKKSVSSADAVERFQREAKAAAKLTHPNIVTAHDADEAGGTHFLVMEYVEGTDLSALVKSQGPLAIPQAISCILQAARGLQHAHAQGVIHRDIKPSNLLLDKQGRVKILDMGLARISEPGTENSETSPQADLTQSGSMMGTVDYMAPEQALNTHQADQPADIYSLGCTLYYLLVGRPPYGGETAMKRLVAHRETPIPSLRAARPEVPAELDDAYQRMVAKHVANRYASMNDVIAALDKLSRSSAAAAPPVAAQGNRMPLLLGAGAVVAALVLVAIFAFRPKAADDEPPTLVAALPAKPASAPARATEEKPAPQPAVEPMPLEKPAEPSPNPTVKTEQPSLGAREPVLPVAVSPPAVAESKPVEPAGPTVAMAPPAAEPTTPDTAPETPVDDRAPIPDAAAQKTALAVIKQIFEADYAAAKNADGKAALTQKLLAQADSTADDPAARFVLLSEARDIAADLADTAAIDKAVEALASHYRIDALAMQADIYQKLVTKSRPATANKALAESALVLAEKAIAAEQLAVGEQLLKAASISAGKARDPALVKQTRARNEELAAFKQQMEAIRKAEDALAKNAADPEANLTLGKYLCFEQDDWDAGLPHLAKGSDGGLKELASKSLAAPTEAAAVAALGDAWWDAADARKGKDAAAVRNGARHWYAAALPELTGINKIKIEKRLAESQAAATAPKIARTRSKTGAQPVDVLKLIDPQRDAPSGGWQRLPSSSGLSGSGEAKLLQIPTVPPAEYSLSLVVTRRSQGTPLIIGLPVVDRQCYVVVESAGKTGLGTIDRVIAIANETTTDDTHLEIDQPTTVVCRVAQSGIRVTVGDKKVIDYTGDLQRLSLAGSIFAVPNPSAAFIGTNGPGTLDITRLEFGPADSGNKPGPKTNAATGTAGSTARPRSGPTPPAAVAPFSADEAKAHQERWAQSRKVPVEMTNSIGMKFVFIPAGEFMIGSTPEQIEMITPRYKDTAPLAAEQPQHKVKISKPFYLGMYEVTQQEYAPLAGKNPSFYSAGGQRKDEVAGVDTSRFPVDGISWNDAAAFCDALSALPGERAAGRQYRLPTEAEWEFACRAGTTTLWSFGDDEKDINRFAWCNQPKTAATHVVGGKLPNAFGLFDMHGNVNEMCLDWYTKDGYANATAGDPKGPASGEGRATRGGAFLNSPVANRCAFRHISNPEFHYPERGFRVLCMPR